VLPYEYELIDKLLKDKDLEHLKCKLLYQRKYSEVVAILNLFFNLPEEQKELFMPLLTSTIWNSNLKNVEAIFDIFSELNNKGNEKQKELFKPLLTSTIWNSNPENAKSIIDIFSNLRKEQEKLFRPLLTPNIWHSNPKGVKAIIDIFSNLTKEQETLFKPLLTSTIWHSNPENVRAIIDIFSKLIKEGNEEQKELFIPLLTSTIWHSNPENVRAIIESKIWQNRLYRKLLTKSIWNKSITKIEKVIETMEELKLEEYITPTCLNLSPIQIKALYHYLQDNNNPVIIDNKLNPLFNVAPLAMLKRYGVNLKQLVAKEKERELKKVLSQ